VFLFRNRLTLRSTLFLSLLLLAVLAVPAAISHLHLITAWYGSHATEALMGYHAATAWFSGHAARAMFGHHTQTAMFGGHALQAMYGGHAKPLFGSMH
jgi:hypothetical protein